MNINPEMLKMQRSSRRLSQEGLAGLSKVSKKTISRIESGHIAPSKIRSTTIERLAKALEVKPEDLANVPEEGPLYRAVGYRPLKTYINADTALAYEFVEHRYRVPSEWLVSMAPLFFTLLAEGSLAWRRQKLSEAKAVSDHANSVHSTARHLLFAAYAVDGLEEGAEQEEASIEKSDLFGAELESVFVRFGYDPSERTPFADYLRQLAAGIDPSVVVLDAEGEKLSRGIPKHRIGHAELNRITGGDFWAKFALGRGHARIRDIPEELLGDSASEKRIAWLTERIPQKAREEFDALIRSLDEDKTMGPTNA